MKRKLNNDYYANLSKCCKCSQLWNTGNAEKKERYVCPDCEKNLPRGMKSLIRGWARVGMI